MEEKIKEAYEKIEQIMLDTAATASDETEAVILVSMIAMYIGQAFGPELHKKIEDLFKKQN